MVTFLFLILKDHNSKELNDQYSAKRRSKIEYSDLEYKTKLRLKLEEKTKKVKNNKKYLARKK
jgi:hypothetical protein